jgi:hypothetical protein
LPKHSILPPLLNSFRLRRDAGRDRSGSTGLTHFRRRSTFLHADALAQVVPSTLIRRNRYVGTAATPLSRQTEIPRAAVEDLFADIGK